MTTGAKRGQFMRTASGSIPCLTPTYAFFIIVTLFCMVGYHSWSQSQRLEMCRSELVRLRTAVHSVSQQKHGVEGRLSELRHIIDNRIKNLAHSNELSSMARKASLEKSDEDKNKRILTLENELLQTKEKLERCNAMGMRAQSKMEETETNIRSSTGTRNKTMCDIEMAHQYEEIDKWIKSMVDDRTYSQFQLKFSKDGEKNENDKLQKLEKVVMQRDEIKAVKDERIKEEIRAREAKSVIEQIPKNPKLLVHTDGKVKFHKKQLQSTRVAGVKLEKVDRNR